MMAAVALGAYPDMQACIAEWVAPLLGQAETPDPDLVQTYAQLFPVYREARHALEPVWEDMARQTNARRHPEGLPSSMKVEQRAVR
jgi:erythritol kinase (D-erythritol 1-phosphate-forming)